MTDGDTAEQNLTENTMLLTVVSSGKTCRLVRVVRQEYARRGFGMHWQQFEENMEGMHQGRHHRRGRHGSRRILRRLLDLGITTGCEFQVIHGGGSGPVLIQVRGTRVALGYGLASKLMVHVVD